MTNYGQTIKNKVTIVQGSTEPSYTYPMHLIFLMIVYYYEALRIPGTNKLSIKVVKSKITCYKSFFVPLTFIRRGTLNYFL